MSTEPGTLHADALAVLRGWTAPDDRQERLRLSYVAHLERHLDGLSRSCRPAHLTAGVVVLSPDRERVLLTLHAKAHAWFHLGGHCEQPDTTLAGAALREGLEESGLPELDLLPGPVHLDQHDVPFCGPAGNGAVRHLDVRYAATAPAGADHAVSEESLDVRWWPVDDLPGTTDDLPALVHRARAALLAADAAHPGSSAEASGS